MPTAAWHPNTLKAESECKTFELQDKLPQLPVPELEETLNGYLRALKPLLSDTEYQKAKHKVESFKQTEAQELQEFLLQKAKRCETATEYPHCTWIEDWWDSVAYHMGRQSLANNVNFFGTLCGGTSCRSQFGRAASFVGGLLEFKYRLDRGQVAVDTLGKNGQLPLCMFQYQRLFGVSRIPVEKLDQFRISTESRHFVVWMDGVMFSVDATHPNGEYLTESEILCQFLRLKAIVNTIPQEERYPISAFTALDRDDWARIRSDLMQKNLVNKQSLDLIETSLFFVTISNESPETPDQVMRLSSQGNHNIWYDKSMNLIVFKNGKVGFNGEHSCSDAPVPSRVLRDACKFALRYDVHESKVKHSLSPEEKMDLFDSYLLDQSIQLPDPRVLEWKLDHSMKTALNRACKFQNQLNSLHQTKTLRYGNYGKRFITKYLKMGPDSFVQMALQLAYYRDQGTLTSTYESATMRTFHHGRTDTILSLTSEARAFVEAMENDRLTAVEKFKTFREAVKSHQKLARQALMGKGISRHLIGLKLAAHEMKRDPPEIFLDESFTKFSTYDLSTSQMDSLFDDFPGFGAPTETSYGVCYLCSKDSYLLFTITSHRKSSKKDCRRFAAVVTKALDDLEDLFRQATGSKL